MKLKPSTLYYLAVLSLAFLWIFTGLTSLFFAPDVGYQILAQAGIRDALADACVYMGASLDIFLGLWLLAFPWINFKWIKLCCLIQLGAIVAYSSLLTVIDSSFWLHPFGPISKNLPILVLILFVFNYGAGKANNHQYDA